VAEKPKSSNQLIQDRLAAFAVYSPDPHNLLMSNLRNEADAQDLLQEIFLRYLRVRHDKLVKQPRAYLFGIAFHVLSGFRSKLRLSPITFNSQTVECLAETPADLAASTVEADAFRHDLARQLQNLPHAYREVLFLRMEAGLSYKKIAKEMGISASTVKKYLVNAKACLRMNHG